MNGTGTPDFEPLGDEDWEDPDDELGDEEPGDPEEID